jgi:hypothetical protein
MTNDMMLILIENARKNILVVHQELNSKKRMGVDSLQVALDQLKAVYGIVEQGENLEKVQ